MLLPYQNYQIFVRLAMAMIASIILFFLKGYYSFLVDSPTDLNQDKSGLVFSFISSSAVYAGIYGAILYVYENYFWRWHNRHYDFNGYWEMKIEYQYLERPSGGDVLDLPHVFESVFCIKQSLFDLSFPEGFSAKNEIWQDRSLRLTKNGIDMSYEVIRSDKCLTDPLPARTVGFESIIVQSRGFLGIPIYMIGNFYHSALPVSALYRGTTTYNRIKKDKYHEMINIMRQGKYITSYTGEKNEIGT